MSPFSKNTNVEHEEQFPSLLPRGFFWPEFVEIGDSVTLALEAENIALNTEVQIEIFPEDEPGNVVKTLTGQVDVGGLQLLNVPIDFPPEILGPNHFRAFRFRAKVSVAGYDVTLELSDNPLIVGELGVGFQSLDERFAPQVEQVELRYKFIDPQNQIVGAKLKVYATNYEGKSYPDAAAVVHEEEITAERRLHNSDFTWCWDGESAAQAGPLKPGDDEEKYVNPLYSPYVVEIKWSTTEADPDADSNARTNYKRRLDDGTEVDWQTRVEFHSIGLELGDFVPPDALPDKGSDRSKWIQWRLNTLGYPCGPVDGDLGEMTKRAVKNFQRAHWEVPWPVDPDANRVPLVADGDVGDKTFAVLESEEVERRDWFSSRDFSDPDEKIKIYVWSNVFYSFHSAKEDGEQEWKTAHRDEWWDKRYTPRSYPREQKEANVLNRPYIPLLAKLYVKNKAGEAAFVPAAVGEVRVNFAVNDPDEDLDQTSYNAGNVRRTYIDHARQEKSTATGDNCPEDFAGMRKLNQNAAYKVYFQVGKGLKPYESKDDGGKKVVYVKTPTEGDAQGAAGVFFVPSYKAGDNYRLQVTLDFDGHPNRANIEAAGTPITVQSPTFTIWRKVKVAAFLSFCTRNGAPGSYLDLDDAIMWGLAEYDYCFTDYERPQFTGSVTQFLTEDEYKKLVYSLYNLVTPAEKATVHFRPNSSIYPFDLRTQNNGETPLAYRTFVRTTVEEFCDRAFEPLGKIIINNVRKRCREGNVVIDFQPHDPVVLYQNRGLPTETVLNNNYRSTTYAIGLHNGLVYLDIILTENLNMDFAHLLAHELGHTCFLYHWENTDTATLTDATNYDNPANFRVNLDHHDHNDTNCIMSYPVDFGVVPTPPAGAPYTSVQDFIKQIKANPNHVKNPQLATNYRPYFCGKCLLKLRGWNVYKLPRKY